MESHSHGAFKCRLKYCNYETSAHDRTVVITSQKVGIAEWHFAVVSLSHTDVRTHEMPTSQAERISMQHNISYHELFLTFLLTISETQTEKNT